MVKTINRGIPIVGDNSIQPISLNQVDIKDDFWAPRIEINTKITIPHVIQKCEKTGRFANFSRAAGLLNDGKRPIFPFDDSDVFKIIEGVAYSLILKSDPKLETYMDELIENIGFAQEDDGYLYTDRTINPENPHKWAGKERWVLVEVLSHELYNVGHLIEAAIAYKQATGKDNLLKIAIKSVDLIKREFGLGKLEKIPGHQEIELALIRLFRLTEERKYLELAKFFLDIRGTTKKVDLESYSENDENILEDLSSYEYNQSHKKIIEQNNAVGHAVRAAYMYSAATDVGLIYKDPGYKIAMNRIWNNVVSKKMYITGGIGSSSEGESFEDNYHLPNFEAYAETCAAIGNIFWNYRLFLLYGNGKFLDILERTLYNGFLSGISLNGKKFAYANPLASKGNNIRKSWWACPCCPSNVVRFIPQLPKYIYATVNNTIFVNLFIGSSANFLINDSKFTLNQETDYPWDGKVKFKFNMSQSSEFSLAIRIPGWAQNKPVPSDLYYYFKPKDSLITLKINDNTVDFRVEKGFVKIQRKWHDSDKVELNLPLSIRRVISHKKVQSNAGMVTLERGPLVYCLEGIDNDVNSIFNLILNDNTELKTEFQKDLLNGVTIITGNMHILQNDEDSHNLSKETIKFMAIPYYAWSNRGRSQMSVWIPREIRRDH
ncbi:MAG: glycoside hydrolase family 127 protein [Candidatus Heimdallarchaeota archaeon]